MTGVGVLGAWRRWRVWAYETQGQQRALAPKEEIPLAPVNSFRANKAGVSEGEISREPTGRRIDEAVKHSAHPAFLARSV